MVLLNLMVDSMISLFVILFYILLLYIKISARWSSGRTVMSSFKMREMLLSMVALEVVNRGQRIRKCSEVSLPESHRHKGDD